MDQNTTPEIPELSTLPIEQLQTELQTVQSALEMLFTKNNSLDELDITHGGGSPEDQAEYQRLYKAERDIVGEINKRHMLSELK